MSEGFLNGPSIHVRPALPGDECGLARVHVDAWRETYVGLISQAFLDDLSYEKREKMWARVLASPSEAAAVHVAVCERDGVVGFVAVDRSRKPELGLKGELEAIYLLEAFQGQGLGRELFCAGCLSLIQHGLDSMYLWVLEENPTRGFYERMGGEQFARETIDLGGERLQEIGSIKNVCPDAFEYVSITEVISRPFVSRAGLS